MGQATKGCSPLSSGFSTIFWSISSNSPFYSQEVVGRNSSRDLDAGPCLTSTLRRKQLAWELVVKAVSTSGWCSYELTRQTSALGYTSNSSAARSFASSMRKINPGLKSSSTEHLDRERVQEIYISGLSHPLSVLVHNIWIVVLGKRFGLYY